MHEDNKRMAASNSRENRMSRDPMTSSHRHERDTGETAGISGLTELLCMETMTKPQAHTLIPTMRVSKGRMGHMMSQDQGLTQRPAQARQPGQEET